MQNTHQSFRKRFRILTPINTTQSSILLLLLIKAQIIHMHCLCGAISHNAKRSDSIFSPLSSNAICQFTVSSAFNRTFTVRKQPSISGQRNKPLWLCPLKVTCKQLFLFYSYIGIICKLCCFTWLGCSLNRKGMLLQRQFTDHSYTALLYK